MSKLQGRVALATGASRRQGIGAAICRAFGERRRRRGMEVDLSHPEAAGQVFTAAEAALGVPTILVNNAAHSTSDRLIDLNAASLDAHYAVNIRSTCLLSVERARRFPGGHGGRIGQGDDVARLVTFLASDVAEWVTGQVIHSEGGFRRQ